MNSVTPVSTPVPGHDPVALFSNSPALLSLPQLPEAPCSVNCFFEVNGMKAQATGRGRTPKEAADNLRDTIKETMAAFSDTLSFPKRIAQCVARWIKNAAEQEAWEDIARIGVAASLVVRGHVFDHPDADDMYVVWGHDDVDQYFVHKVTGCGCGEPGGWNCEHGKAVLLAQTCNAIGSTDSAKQG